MKNFRIKFAPVVMCLLAIVVCAVADPAKPLYENDFEKAELDKVPDDFLVLDGGFAVKQEGTNKFLELPGAPLDSFGLLFGPTEKTEVTVTARIKSEKKGRRYPTFAVGLDGQSGYRLQVSPAKNAIELYKGDVVLTNAPFDWKSGEWTHLFLQIAKSGDVWKISGKAWTHGNPTPGKEMISYDEKTEPSAGRASIWGSPFANTPVQFDDIVMSRPEAK